MKKIFLFVLLVTLMAGCSATGKVASDSAAVVTNDPYVLGHKAEAQGKNFEAILAYDKAGDEAKADLQRVFEKLAECKGCAIICDECLKQLEDLRFQEIITKDEAARVTKSLARARKPASFQTCYECGNKNTVIGELPRLYRLAAAFRLPNENEWALVYAKALIAWAGDYQGDLDQSPEWLKAYEVVSFGVSPSYQQATAEMIGRSIRIQNVQRLNNASEWLKKAGYADPGKELVNAVRAGADQRRAEHNCLVAGQLYAWLGDEQNKRLMERLCSKSQ